MAPEKLTALHDFFTRFGAHPSLVTPREKWRRIAKSDRESNHSTLLIALIDSATLFLEREMHARAYPQALLDLHRQLFLEMESLIADLQTDERHRFIVVIPVADRPRHLQSCLDSLFNLCRRYNYGGLAQHRYTKITVLIADDSKDPDNRARHEQIQQHFSQQGLETIYFGQDEQLRQLDRLNISQRRQLIPIVGDAPAEAFHHKGASITRNLSYLKLKQLTREEHPTLIWFVDSDQEFRVTTAEHPEGLFAINYFHRLDRIFTTTDTRVLTGKVVGDPPVSPAVMAGNCLRDVLGFVTAIARLEPDHGCPFHQQPAQEAGDASYHDMADLFGFHPKQEAFIFQCRLGKEHDLMACLKDYAQLLNRFFDGEHLTRQNVYTHSPETPGLAPARTLYTGNYILTPSALNYFIPFATLKLRMAGPQLGRILKTELGNRFVSANLPLLHKRAREQSGESEFRPGIEKHREGIDISGEFERQFFGDVMLFTLRTLIQSGYPQQQMSAEQIGQALHETETTLLHRYHKMQQDIISNLDQLADRLDDRDRWWWREPGAADSIEHFQRFIHNMRSNFGETSPGYAMIQSTQHRLERKEQMLQALCAYSKDRNNWRKILDSIV